MPQNERDKLNHHVNSALDYAQYLIDAEILEHEDTIKLLEISELLKYCAEETDKFVRSVNQKRKERNAQPIERTYFGPVFSWGEHDKKIERDKNRRKIEKIRQQILMYEEKLKGD